MLTFVLLMKPMIFRSHSADHRWDHADYQQQSAFAFLRCLWCRDTRWIRLRLRSYGDDIASIRAFGEEVVTDLCDQLLTAGAPGLHFYSLNQADAVLAIADNLELTS
jgi:5,10-methylenetetrahydrofolate reductase